MKKATLFTSFLLLFSLNLIGRCSTAAQNKSLNARISFDVGIVHDLESTLGKMSNVCISIALDDFYTTHSNYNTKLILHWRDSNEDDVEAASMGERLVSNWSRLVVIVWMFVVWILTSSYSASFSSLLTLQQLKTINDIEDLIKNGDNVGYRQGSSFVLNLLKDLKVEESKLKAYSTPEEYAEALSKRAVGAIFDEIPYLRLFLARSGNCAQYKMAGRVYPTDGFGFVFPRGSPLVPDLNKEILAVLQEENVKEIQKKTLGLGTTCLNEPDPTNSLTLDSSGASSLSLEQFQFRLSPSSWFCSLARMGIFGAPAVPMPRFVKD